MPGRGRQVGAKPFWRPGGRQTGAWLCAPARGLPALSCGREVELRVRRRWWLPVTKQVAAARGRYGRRRGACTGGGAGTHPAAAHGPFGRRRGDPFWEARELGRRMPRPQTAAE
jgi:hypothetical protein